MAGALVILLCLASLLVCVVPASAQGVTVELTPAFSEVAPGDEFDLDLTVTHGSPFTSFYAVIVWNPYVLTLVSNVEGTFLTDYCQQTFDSCRTGPGADSISAGVRCEGLELVGPGQLHRIRFRASTFPQQTLVQFLPGLQFFNDLVPVNPVYSTGAAIGIGVPVGVEGQRGASDLRLTVAPNPARGRTVFTIEAMQAGSRRMRLVDPRGCIIRRFEDFDSAPGVRTVAWDGLNDAGGPVSAGVYFVTLETAGRRVSRTVFLIK